MKLAFSGQGRYPDFDSGYELYCRRARNEEPMSRKDYHRVIRSYCRYLAKALQDEGMVDLPSDIGSISAAIITRRPQYRGKRFVGYGKMDWEKGHYDGKLKAFGLVFLARHGKNRNLRGFGFVANRRLFKKMKEMYMGDDCPWTPIEFNNAMI